MSKKRQQYAVLGLGRFGRSVCRTLYRQGHEVLGADVSQENVLSAHDEEIATHVVQADTTSLHALEELGVANFDAVVVAIGSDLEASILTVLNVLELGVRRIVTKASHERHGQVLERIGGKAVQVVYPESQMGERVANALSGADILETIELDPHTSIVEMGAPAELVGKSLRQADLRARFGVTVIAIKHGETLSVAPMGDEVVRPGDIITVLGPTDRIVELKGRPRPL